MDRRLADRFAGSARRWEHGTSARIDVEDEGAEQLREITCSGWSHEVGFPSKLPTSAVCWVVVWVRRQPWTSANSTGQEIGEIEKHTGGNSR